MSESEMSFNEFPTKRPALPDGWKWLRLGESDVAEINPRPSHLKGLPEDTPVSFVPMPAVNAEQGRITAPEQRKLRDVRRGFTAFKNSDVLFAKITPCMENGKAAIARELESGIGFGSTEFHVIRPSPKVMPEWVYHYVRQERFRSAAAGSFSGAVGQQRVPRDFLASSWIPVPARNVQEEVIAQLEARLSRLDKAVADLRSVEAKLTRHRASVLAAATSGSLVPTEAELARREGRSYESASVLLDRILAERRARWETERVAAFRAKGKAPRDDGWKDQYQPPSDPDTSGLPTLPEGWAWVSVDQIGESRMGRQRAPQHQHGEHIRPYLRVANVYEDRIDTSDVLSMNFTPKEFEVYQLKPGDILLNEGQSAELVGRPAMYRGEVPGCCFQNTLIRFRPFDGLDRDYALLVFLSYLKNGTFKKIAKITTNIAHLGGTRFSRLHFPLPPQREQKRIVEKVAEGCLQIDVATKAMARSLKRSASLRSAILQSAFQPPRVTTGATHGHR